MNNRKTFILWLLGGMMFVGITACSGDDETADMLDDGVKARRITITQTGEAATQQAISRASLVEDAGLTASWMADDGLTYCNLSRTNLMTMDIYSGLLNAVSSAVTSQFTGDVMCSKGDYLAVVYPVTTFETNDSYTISLTGQNGTLDKLATKFHYVFGKAHVTSVTDVTASATMEKMKSLLTVCKFSFVDKDGGADIPVKSLAISYGGTGSDAGTYPQTATVTLNSGGILEQTAVHAMGVAGSTALTVTCPSEQGAVYVALLPTSGQRTFRFTVTNASGTYSGMAHATLAEGEYVVATGLRLMKQ
ncbi:MAG: hypothetical protein IJT97_04165 [Bacteroidaceae bacterium]|nr:hypothetical protein [Bacteroidaceae bacterium]